MRQRNGKRERERNFKSDRSDVTASRITLEEHFQHSALRKSDRIRFTPPLRARRRIAGLYALDVIAGAPVTLRSTFSSPARHAARHLAAAVATL
ncbi:hypothetical protein EVAR_91035_1 [Eumeta japonica]|uniref:Uncharacterized protein n=1 Tax=Eumeta variegata TaxID=151549 RepID=A0A4C1T0E6_EUMVA|nr:hypothetical protein EVAR_91035_1 [Eumeta japonica]